MLSVPIPPRWDASYTECFGFSMEDLFEQGAISNEAKLRAIGIPLDDIAHFPFPMDVTPRERGEQALALLRAGFLGERNGAIPRDPATVRILMDLMARTARGTEVPHVTTIPWDFRDADPWYLQLEGTHKLAVQGRVAKPTVRMRMRFDDFAELVSKRAAPPSLVARRRLRPWATRGSC